MKFSPATLNATIEEIAAHEASHAVVARFLQIPVRYASLDPPQIETDCEWTQLNYRRSVVIDLAGYSMTNSGGEIDEQHALLRCRKVVAMRYHPGNRSSAMILKKRLRAVADRLVREHKGTIERVAGELLRRGRLEQAEIDEVIAGGPQS
jgi:hypothetical protein